MFRTIGPIHWLIAASAVGVGGCSIETRPAAYPERPVIYEAAQPAPAPEPVVIQAPPAPPPGPPAQPVLRPPSPDYGWTAGHYRWNGHTYVWQRARYERRPHPHARYVPGHWERRGHARIWIEGRWD
jgi:hypothetical protein